MAPRKPLSQLILSALQRGDELTVLDGLIRWNTMTLSQRISELRRAGHGITKRQVTRNGKTIAAYSIPRPQPAP